MTSLQWHCREDRNWDENPSSIHNKSYSLINEKSKSLMWIISSIYLMKILVSPFQVAIFEPGIRRETTWLMIFI